MCSLRSAKFVASGTKYKDFGDVMQDVLTLRTFPSTEGRRRRTLMAVFDGHGIPGGEYAAACAQSCVEQYVQRHLVLEDALQIAMREASESIVEGYGSVLQKAIEQRGQGQRGPSSSPPRTKRQLASRLEFGTTAAVCVLEERPNGCLLHVSNVGDSDIVLGRARENRSAESLSGCRCHSGSQDDGGSSLPSLSESATQSSTEVHSVNSAVFGKGTILGGMSARTAQMGHVAGALHRPRVVIDLEDEDPVPEVPKPHRMSQVERVHGDEGPVLLHCTDENSHRPVTRAETRRQHASAAHGVTTSNGGSSRWATERRTGRTKGAEGHPGDLATQSVDAMLLSESHTHVNRAEVDRVIQAGMRYCGPPSPTQLFPFKSPANRGISLTRSLGHVQFAQCGVIPDPYIAPAQWVCPLHDRVLIAASDGLWQAVDCDYQRVVEVATNYYPDCVEDAAQALGKLALGVPQADNIAIAVTFFVPL